MKRGVTPGKVHDSVSYLRRLDRQRERFALDVKAMGLNAGYANAPIAQGLEERKILGVTGYLRRGKRKGMMPKRDDTFDAETDSFRCPERSRPDLCHHRPAGPSSPAPRLAETPHKREGPCRR